MSPTTGKTVVARRPLRAALLPALAVLATATLTPGQASASGFVSARFGSDYGNPVGDNAFSVYYNPAALTAAKGTQLSLDGLFVYRRARYDRTELTPSSNFAGSDQSTQAYQDYRSSNTGKAKLDNFLASPFLGFVTDFGRPELPIRAGIAVYIPFGGQSSWGRNSNYTGTTAPGGNDGQQRWFNISGKITSIYVTPAISVAIPGSGVSIGLNGSYVHNSVETVRARNADGSDDTATSSGGLVEGRSFVDVSGSTFAGAVGLYYQSPDNKLRVGASYTARPGFGQMRLKGDLHVQLRDSSKDSTTPIDFLQTYPDVMRLGFGYRVSPKVDLRADINYVTWSVFKRQCLVNQDSSKGGTDKCNLYDNGSALPDTNGRVVQSVARNWRDAYGLRVSGTYFLSDDTDVFGSLGYDTSAVTAENLDPGLMDAFKLIGSVGIRQQLGSRFRLAAAYNHVYFFDVDSTGKNHNAQLKAPSAQPSAAGKYSQQYMILNVNGTVFF